MRGPRVHFDFRGQVRLGERLFQNVLLFGRPRSSLAAIAMRNCALLFAACRCGLFGGLVTRPPPWNEATAPRDRHGGRGTKRHRATHAIALCADLPILGNRDCCPARR